MTSKNALVALSLLAITALVGAVGCSADPMDDGSDEEAASEDESVASTTSEQGLTSCITGKTSCMKGAQLKCGRYCGAEGPDVYQLQAVCVEGKWYCSTKRTHACKYTGVAACG